MQKISIILIPIFFLSCMSNNILEKTEIEAKATAELAIKIDSNKIESGITNYDIGNTIVGTTKIISITLENPRVGNLILTGNPLVVISGANSAEFEVVQPATSIILPKSSLTFQIRFRPTSAGTKTIQVSIPSNSYDKNEFIFTLTGVAILGPKIKVQQQGIEITNGGSFTLDSIASNTSLSVIFTIYNSGSADLILNTTSVEISGTDAGFFSVVQPDIKTIPAKSNAIFTLTFTPTTPGNRSISLTIRSNDAIDGAFTFTVQASASLLPEINLKEGTSSIANNGSYNFGSTLINVAKEVVFTIENIGNADLLLTNTPAIIITGTNSDLFTVSAQPTGNTITAANSITFKISFLPTAEGNYSATVLIPNNDSNESNYRFTIYGTGSITPQPDIHIKEGSNNYATGSTYNFGNVEVYSSQTITFTIQNLGTTNLVLNASLPLSITGTHSNQFSFTAAGSSTINSSGSTTFTVTFSPTSLGTKNATLYIQSNDPDEGIYIIYLTGTGSAGPEINVKQGSTNLPSGTGTYDFGNVVRLNYAVATFTIENTGTSNLNLTGNITISGTDANHFLIMAQPSNTITPGSSVNFMVYFFPRPSTNTPSLKTATVTIPNNDSNESSYTFTITGTDALPADYDWKYDGIWFVTGRKDPTTLAAEVYVYDPYKDEWRTTGIANITTPVRNAAAAGVRIDATTHKIYVFGGINASNTIVTNTQIYNINTNVWSAGTAMPAARQGHAAILADGSIYLLGGSSTTISSGINTTSYRFRPFEGESWVSHTTLTASVMDISLAYLDGQIVYGGGRVSTGTPANVIYASWPITLAFQNNGNLRQSKYAIATASYSDANLKYVFFVGGNTYSTADTNQFPAVINSTNQFEIYIPYAEGGARVVLLGPNLNQPRAYAQAVVKGNYLYVFGGASNTTSLLKSVERINILTLTTSLASWEYMTDMPANRYGFCAVTIR